DMQRTFNSYKSLVISVNLSSHQLQQRGRRGGGGESAELRELLEHLQEANRRWTQACAALQAWEGGLQAAVMECQEFHETLHSLLLGLARVEGRLQASSTQEDGPASPSALLGHRTLLTEVQGELQGQQERVASLQEISSQLLLEVTEEEGLEAKEKVHVVANKLRLLLRRVAGELQALRGRLEVGPGLAETDSSTAELATTPDPAPDPALPALHK
ncbi:hypothetical protein CRUP_035224, partial [Coryphaenoides rupestris]